MKSIQAFALSALVVAFCLPGLAHATGAEQLLLPVQLSAGCQTCHAGAGVSATEVPAEVSAELTDFGQDWLSFGRSWNPDIAAENSDGDGCLNGFELGDRDGTWQPSDGYLTPSVEQNPARAGDCTLPVDEKSFGVLKSLFGD